MDAQDLARIRFVTSRYQELQGLRQLVVLPCCLVAFWSRPLIESLRDTRYRPTPWRVSSSQVGAVAAGRCASRPVLDRYYSAAGLAAVGTGSFRLVAGHDRVGGADLSAGFWLDCSTFGVGQAERGSRGRQPHRASHRLAGLAVACATISAAAIACAVGRMADGGECRVPSGQPGRRPADSIHHLAWAPTPWPPGSIIDCCCGRCPGTPRRTLTL